MKNVLIIIFSLLIISTVVSFFYLSFSFGVFPSDDGFNSDEIIVIDSVQITSNKVYWFCNKADCGTSSMGRLSYCKSTKLISDENVFFVSSYITNLDYDSDRNLL
jgi:hypothetical protein